MLNDDYDVRKAFEKLELELIDSMRRNLLKHQEWEKEEGINWSMWQAEQLATLETFRKENQKVFDEKFDSVNREIISLLEKTYQTSGFDQEREILEMIQSGKLKTTNSTFFHLNKKKMNSLINATMKDMKKAEHAMLRMTNDVYRQTIFNAQVAANSGAKTLKQAIDEATKDFLSSGINCVRYKNGRQVNIASYSEMAIRTANKRAMLVSEGDVRKTFGIHTVRISKYGACSETCLPWQGKVYIDDVWSGGTKKESMDLDIPLLSEAIDGGLFHPNCRHRATTYFPNGSPPIQIEGKEEIPLKEQQERKQHILDHRKERMALRKEIGTNDLPVLTQSANIEERNESLNPSFKHSSTTIKNGKNLVGNVMMRDIYQYEIEDVINQQGFDGPPRLVTNIDEFYHFVDKDHFIGERTFSGNSKRLVDEWYEQLKHGEFYVKCREGGFQYGRGLYCAADYTKGTIDYSKFQHEIDQYARNKKYVKTIWMTVDPSVKIIDFDDIQFEYACEWMINKYPNKVTKIDDLKCLNKQIKDACINDDISPKELLRLKKQRQNIELEINFKEGYGAANLRIKKDGYDWGILAAEMGYDVINSKGHGATGSYTVILNRTKLILFDGDGFVYKRRD